MHRSKSAPAIMFPTRARSNRSWSKFRFFGCFPRSLQTSYLRGAVSMPSQLVYTSAPRGLVSGQSGFCVVARSTDLREALSQRLERISSYHYLEVTTAHLSTTKSGANLNPTICAYRVLDLRGTKYHVLTRIQPTGLDFTA